MESKPGSCELCGSTQDYLNFHHLIPRMFHSKERIRKAYKKEFLRNHGIWVCKFFCHKEIHQLVSERAMAFQYNSRELLLGHPLVHGYVEWRRKRVR